MRLPTRTGVDRGQTAPVGMLLFVGLVVTVTSVTGYYVLTDITEAGTETSVEIRGTVSAETVQLTHYGGESLRASRLQVRLVYDGTVQTYDFTANDGCAGGDGNGRFDPGERWCLSGPPPYGAGDAVRLLLVDTETNRVLYRAQKTARVPPPTLTPAPTVPDVRDGGDGGTATPDGPDEEPAPPDGGAFADADGDGRYDSGETTYTASDLYEFDDPSVDLVVPATFGTLERQNQAIDIRAASITVNADIAANNAELSLTATRGDIDASGVTLTSSNNPITIDAAGTVDVTGTDISADNGAATIRASKILLTDGRITSQNNPITLESTGGDGTIVADGATITADNAGVTLTTSNGRDLSIRHAQITSKNNPITIRSAGELDAAGATIAADNAGVTLRSGGSDNLSVRNADVDARNNPIVVDSAGKLTATDASLVASNGDIEAVSHGDMCFERALLSAKTVTANLNGKHALYVEGVTVNDRIRYTPGNVEEKPRGSNAAEPA